MRKRFAAAVLPLFLLTMGTGCLLAGNGGVSGAIFTTLSDGGAVNANHFESKCAVYLDGGPGPNAPAKAAGLADGDYYFQVTDPSGKQLLSTDPVSNRRFHVTGGVIVQYTGIGGPAHPVGFDRDHAELGATTIQLANTACPVDFTDSPNAGGAYKVWATPVSDFVGDAASVDSACGSGCYHGFVASQSKTDNFKVNASSATFCVTVEVGLDAGSGQLEPGANWGINVTDPQGVTNTYYTDATGRMQACGLTPGAYTVREVLPDSTISVGLIVNNKTVPTDEVYSFTWGSNTQAPVIEFENRALLLPQ